MPNKTKQAIADSLRRLLLKKSLNKITINDIAEECGMNRMTFYYHFRDIYDLVEWICMEDARAAKAGRYDSDTWQDGLLRLCRSVLNDRVFIESAYRSIQREKVENYMYDVTYDILINVIEKQAGSHDIPESDKKFIADFYKYAFVGIALDWVRTGMKESPEDLVAKVSTLITGQFELAIRNFTSF